MCLTPNLSNLSPPLPRPETPGSDLAPNQWAFRSVAKARSAPNARDAMSLRRWRTFFPSFRRGPSIRRRGWRPNGYGQCTWNPLR